MFRKVKEEIACSGTKTGSESAATPFGFIFHPKAALLPNRYLTRNGQRCSGMV